MQWHYLNCCLELFILHYMHCGGYTSLFLKFKFSTFQKIMYKPIANLVPLRDCKPCGSSINPVKVLNLGFAKAQKRFVWQNKNLSLSQANEGEQICDLIYQKCQFFLRIGLAWWFWSLLFWTLSFERRAPGHYIDTFSYLSNLSLFMIHLITLSASSEEYAGSQGL